MGKFGDPLMNAVTCHCVSAANQSGENGDVMHPITAKGTGERSIVWDEDCMAAQTKATRTFAVWVSNRIRAFAREHEMLTQVERVNFDEGHWAEAGPQSFGKEHLIEQKPADTLMRRD